MSHEGAKSLWTKPKHHFEAGERSDHVHWVELFYDLIHVATIFILGNYLSHHLDIQGVLTFAGVFIALWFAWADLSAYNSLYISTDAWHRVVMAVLICTVMIMGAAIPAITGNGWPYFALAFAVNRALLALLYYRVQHIGEDASALPREMGRNFLVLAAVFTLSAFLPKPAAFWVFAIGVISIQLLYALPLVGLLRFERFVPRLGHLAERFALLTLIVLGEGFFKLVVTLSEKGVYKVTPDILINFIIGGLSIFAACWVYFETVGNSHPRNERTPTLVIWWLAHLLLMLCGVMIGVAVAGEVKIGFMDPFPVDYGAVGCIGLAGYIGAVWIIQSVTEPSDIHQYATPLLHAFGIALSIATFFIVPYVPSIVGNMLWGTALFSQILIPLLRARLAHKPVQAL
ncbi:low temperature requirement protein A [Henriciella sp.]|uniref:low temperature requirement protein A n=1 Tax=Henriciella sp. TaxID=1968823 RepID=UPI002603DB83|nr:low temperature requirement protein A [Henriciella sp.]